MGCSFSCTNARKANNNNTFFFVCFRRTSSRIFFSGAGDYVSRERCREDYYTLASTPIPLSDVECSATPLSIAVQQQNQIQSSLQQQQQHQQQQQSPLPPPQSNAVLYTVQRVITTSQIQQTGSFVGAGNISTLSDTRSAEMLDCGNSSGTNLHLPNATNNACSNNYQTQSHQIISQLTETQHNSNFYGAPSTNGAANNTVAINRNLQNVSICAMRKPCTQYSTLGSVCVRVRSISMPLQSKYM